MVRIMAGKKKKLRCYIYTRVSTQMQVEGYSLDAQRERLQREAKHRDMTVAAEFSDEGKSGKNTTGRPQFTEMLRRIQTGNPDGVSYVLVFKLSRFGRNAADVLNNLQLMQDFGVNLLCVDDGIDSSKDSGKLTISVISAVAELERENIRTQTMAGRWQKAREGKWNGGKAPYGYRIENDVLVIEESEAEQVRLIFDKFAHTDMGYSGVASWLNDKGYRKTARYNDESSRFSLNFVKAILDNPVYTGKIVYGRHKSEKIEGTRNEYHRVKQAEYEIYEGKHEAIISDEVWEATRHKRTVTGVKTEKRYGFKHVHVLSGLVKCPECGAPMYGRVYSQPKSDGSGERYEGWAYYLCRNASATTSKKCGYRRNIRQQVLNAQVRPVVQDILLGINLPEQVVEAMNEEDDLDALNAELKTLESARDKEVRKKNKLVKKIVELDADDAMYDAIYASLESALREFTQSIAELEERIGQVSAEIHQANEEAPTADQIRRIVRTLINAIDVSPEGERLVMQTLIDSIQIYPEPLPSGLILKSIRLKIPLNKNGFVFSTIEMVDDDDVDNDEEDEGESSGGDIPPGGNPPTGGDSSPDDDRGPDGAPTLGGGLVPVQNSLPNVNTVSLYLQGNLLGRYPVKAQEILFIYIISNESFLYLSLLSSTMIAYCTDMYNIIFCIWEI